MSDHDTPEQNKMDRDPMDQAYVQAEAMLDDVEALAARRARVLAAVAAEPAAAVGSPPMRRRARFGRGGWLIAASVVGVSVMVALQIRSPVPVSQPVAPSPPAASTLAPVGPPEVTPRPAPVARTTKGRAPTADAPVAPKASLAAPLAFSAAKPAARAIAPEQTPAAPPAPSPPILAPPPLPVPPVEHRIEEPRPPATARATASSVGNSDINEVIVTAQKRRSPREEKAEQLRGAAEAGQADEVAALLAKGAPVDLPDDAGDTALMKSVRADHPAAAVLLRRNGASLDRRNRAGESARGLAVIVGDPELDRALGLKS
jgi:hypothetical protein